LVPTPPKARRRWGLFAAMVAMVCAGALGVAWLVQASSSAVAVVAARSTIERGSVITGDDLMVVRVEVDRSLDTIPESDLSALVGQRALLDVAAGSLVTAVAVGEQNLPGDGFSLVGVGVSGAMMPGTSLLAGDRIRVVLTADQQVDEATLTGPMSVAGIVVGVQDAGTSATGQAQTVITVEVPEPDAATLAAMAATGRVAVVLDSRDR
jgi:SAF domain